MRFVDKSIEEQRLQPLHGFQCKKIGSDTAVTSTSQCFPLDFVYEAVVCGRIIRVMQCERRL